MGNLSDFDDLVKELDQVEQEAKALQERIAQFMDNARQAFGSEALSSTVAGRSESTQTGLESA